MTRQLNQTKQRSLMVLYRMHHRPPLVLHLSILHLNHSRSRNLRLTLSYTLLRALFEIIPLILSHMPPNTTTSLNI
jgi:hypothetical protein